ncbi:MAG: acyl-CoA synthetase [Eubacteriales bacterium]
MKLEYDTYAESMKNFSYAERWEVFDGNREKFNIAHECVDRHRRESEAVRLQFEDGHREVYTFGELSSLSSRFANMLVRIGVCEGERVALVLNPSLEFYVSFFGTLKRGAVIVPCSALFGPDAINLRVGNSQAKVVVTTREKVYAIDQSLVKKIIVADELLPDLQREPDTYTPDTRADSMAVIQFSSGTTGLPKPVYYRHIAATITAVTMKIAVGLKAGDNYFCPSSPAWGHGIWYGTVGPLMFGSAIGSYSGKYNPGLFVDALEYFGITNVFATPLVFRSAMMTGKMDKRRLRLRTLSFTGGPLDIETQEQYQKILGVVPRSMYGSTEVGVVLAHYPYPDYEIRLGSLGKPMPGVKVSVIEENENNEMPPGEKGQLGIWRKNGWVRMGDAAFVDEDGYFWYGGRIDDVIISAGYTIGAFEVEAVIQQHPAVAKVGVVGSPDQERGEVVKAFIILNQGHEAGEELVQDIQQFVKEKLGKHEYPREVEFVAELPETLDGKIKRKELRERERSRKGVA